MFKLINRVAEFIVFWNVFIALAAAALVAETRYLSGGAWSVLDPFLLFSFFSTLLVYNFHAFSNYLGDVFTIRNGIKNLLNPANSLAIRINVGVGLAGTAVTYFLLSFKMMLLLLPAGLITLAYTLPLVRLKTKSLRLREIMYVKIFSIALMWAVATVLLPFVNDALQLPLSYSILVFAERLFFVYAITVPFEIRDRHRELAKGLRTIPVVYGMKKSKLLAYAVLLLHVATVYIREFLVAGQAGGNGCNVYALLACAITAAILILKTGDNNNKWYFKFMLDGTMIEQFILLILFSKLC